VMDERLRVGARTIVETCSRASSARSLVFRFTGTSGLSGPIQGEMRVSGDEMSGELRGPGFFRGRRDVALRRVDSSRPASQP
jgi:hypothetical protein